MALQQGARSLKTAASLRSSRDGLSPRPGRTAVTVAPRARYTPRGPCLTRRRSPPSSSPSDEEERICPRPGERRLLRRGAGARRRAPPTARASSPTRAGRPRPGERALARLRRAQRNQASDRARHDWVLAVDADERVTPALRDEIEALRRRGFTHAGYRIPRVAHYLGRLDPRRPTGTPIRSCACSTAAAGAGRAAWCTSRCKVDRLAWAACAQRPGALHLPRRQPTTCRPSTATRRSGREQAFARGPARGPARRHSSPRLGPSSATTSLRGGLLLGEVGPHRLDPERVLHLREAGEAARAGRGRTTAVAVRVLHVDSARRLARRAEPGAADRAGDGGARARGGGGLPARRVAGERGRASAGLDVRAVPLPRRPLARGRLGPRAACCARCRPDVVQLHDPHALSAGLWRASSGARAPLVATRRVDFAVKGPLSRWKYRAAARVIAVSARHRGRPGAATASRARAVRVVHEGVPDRAAGTGRTRRAARAGRAGRARWSWATWRRSPTTRTTRRCSTPPRACARRVPARGSSIVGDGELRAPLAAQARALGLGDRCVFAGFRADLDVLLPAFDVFCLSSHMEGLGTSLLDAMASRGRWWRRRAGGIPEAVEDGVTGRVVPARDPDALAAALAEVLRDAPRGARPGRGRARALPRALHRRAHGRRDAGRATTRSREGARHPEPARGPRPRQRARAASLGPRRAGAALDMRDHGARRATRARFAREAAARGDDAVLAVGGDGTVNEAAAGLLGQRARRSGSCPWAPGNGLARTLGMPLRPAAALTALESAVAAPHGRRDASTAGPS